MQGSALLAEVAWASLKGLFALSVLLAVGKWLLPMLFFEVARARSDELFVLSARLLVALLAASLTQWMGLSMALGAFLAGMMLGESHYRHQLEVDIKPFRDVLMGLFFITIGMTMDWALVAGAGWQVLACVTGLILCKSLLILLAGRLMGRRQSATPWPPAGHVEPGREFGFVLLALASHHGLLDHQLVLSAHRHRCHLHRPHPLAGVAGAGACPLPHRQCPALSRRGGPVGPEQTPARHHRRVRDAARGETCARFLKLEEIPFLALDLDPERVSEAKLAGEQVAFGDASRRDILLAAGLLRARLVIITFDDRKRVDAMLTLIRELAGEIKVLVRTRDDSFLEHYKQAGAFEVIPESQEGALMLVSHLLLNCDIPIGRVIRRMEHERSSQYRFLHGFYWGGKSAGNLETDQQLERLHPVLLHDQAWGGGTQGTGSRPGGGAHQGDSSRGSAAGIPRRELVLAAGDTLVLFGTAVAMEQAEQRLLEGR